MERFINIKGAYNVRDIGGYQTQDGGTIKWKKLYRSGKISRIKASENEKMAAMNIQTICDFRTFAEQAASPDQWFQMETIKHCPLPIGEGRLDQPDWLVKASKGTGKDSHLYKANRSYVLKNAHRLREFFEILLDETNYPILYHCTAGKDRTGFATVLLLTALGVDRETIVEDYLLTNDYLDKYFWKELKQNIKDDAYIETIKPILIADALYLEGAFDVIQERYGTVHDFLEKELNIRTTEIQRLKSILVDY